MSHKNTKSNPKGQLNKHINCIFSTTDRATKQKSVCSHRPRQANSCLGCKGKKSRWQTPFHMLFLCPNRGSASTRLFPSHPSTIPLKQTLIKKKWKSDKIFSSKKLTCSPHSLYKLYSFSIYTTIFSFFFTNHFLINIMALYFSILFFLICSVTACDRCVHQTKTAYFSKASALSCKISIFWWSCFLLLLLA